MSIILASASPARAAVLRNAGLEFDIRPARVDEEEIKLSLKAEGAPPERVAETLAELKMRRGSVPGDRSFVIGCDQMLACDGEWFDKPEDMAAARMQLRRLRGKTHQLHAAICVGRDGGVIWHHMETARLTMRDFSDDFLEAYLVQAGDGILASVGAYRLEDIGVQLFSRIQGDYFTILGLPLLPLLDFLRNNSVVRI